ncbi:lipid IV(A) 3-deoxy-D-manno-octulosonic acid transferase [Neisseria polysaccharea]|uniref:lipid IV(A) 3-deoxy-D-manno-octulosonic acid transferase n=1 Tax=Neisseria polysaccharea TaxID=489 RepID=UPI00272AAF16|nr:lipid IV(A) 3-deoxy-D-manno-octulosonic acid transferase [Neisseria polysaccharea]
MFQWLYDVLWLLAPIWIRRYLDKRSGSAPAYRAHRDERFGKPYPNPVTGAVWIHAVSVGETRAAQPLIRELRQRFPDAPLLMTQMTPTGRETAQVLFPDAQCRYLPYDKKTWVRQFLREHRPMFGILMETEIWPNLMKECRRAGVPLFLANARLSEKSLNGYLKVRRLIRPAAASLTGCLAQTEADAARLAKLGAASVQVCGNTKYDLMPSERMKTLAGQFKERIGGRPVAVCGSTRVYRGEDEAEKLLAAWREYRGNALLVVVPRHPEHFQTAFETAERFGFKVQRRSDGLPVEPDTQVWIGDSMGELYAYYLTADAAFVGGSLVDSGCQNIIEPLSCGVPTIFGFSTYNFEQACARAAEAGAAIQVKSADGWRKAVESLLSHKEIGTAARERIGHFISPHRGASVRMAEMIYRSVRNADSVCG